MHPPSCTVLCAFRGVSRSARARWRVARSEVESGLVHAEENVYTEYPDPRRDEWQTKIVPALNNVPLPRLLKLSGKSRRMLIKAHSGRTRPYRKNREMLANIDRNLGLI